MIHCTGSANRSAKQKANHLALAKYLQTDLATESDQPQRAIEQEPVSQTPKQDDLFVWPWVGIIVNIVTEPKNKDMVDAEYWLKKFAKYKPLEAHILWNSEDQTVQAILTFNQDWIGFKNAMGFEKNFEMDHLGKKEWSERKGNLGPNIYGWFARADDYNSEGAIGDYLRNNGELKTISDLVQEAAQNKNDIVANLANKIDMTNETLEHMQYKFNEKSISLMRMIEEKDKLNQAYYEGSLPCRLNVFDGCCFCYI